MLSFGASAQVSQEGLSDPANGLWRQGRRCPDLCEQAILMLRKGFFGCYDARVLVDETPAVVSDLKDGEIISDPAERSFG